MDQNLNSSCVRVSRTSAAVQNTTCQPVSTLCETGQVAPVQPNPVFPVTATQLLLTPLAITQTGTTAVVTVSIPAESFITLPKPALEVKRITKNLKLTQLRFFNAIAPLAAGKPADTPKLFLGGFVRKDIQYVSVTNQTSTTVEGQLNDLVVDIPISAVIDLGTTLTVPPLTFDQQLEYEYFRTMPLPSGFAAKDRLMMGDLTEYNAMSTKFLNRIPTTELIYSQINEMDDAIDRVALKNGPFEEGLFRTLQEKMVVLVQVMITFPTIVDP